MDAWTELDSIIRHQGDYAEVEREKTELVHWKTRAERAEREARAWQEKTRRMAEAVKEERDLHEASYNDLLKDKNSLEEKCSLLESKMLKLIDMVKSGKLSTGGSQIHAAAKNESADLVVEMEKKLKEANQQAEKSNIELAQSKERVTLVESKLRQLAELMKAEREANVKSAAENQSIEVDLLKKKLSEAAQKEQTLQAELSRAQQSSSQPSPQAANAQDAERKVKELEEKLLKIAVGVRKERELKAAEVNELKATNDKLTKQMELYQERLTNLEKEVNANGGSKGAGASAAQQEEQLRLWKQRADEAEERAKRAEMDAQDKISDYKIKVKHLLVQQEAKFKEQSGQRSSTASAEEAERRCRALEQRNRELEASLAAQSSAASSICAPPMSMGAPPPPPPAAAAAAPPPPPPPSAGGAPRSGQPASLMDAIKQGTSLKKAPAGGAPKPKPAVTAAPAGPNLAQMAAELATQRRQRMLNNAQTNRGFRRSVRLDLLLEDVNNP